MKIEKVLYTSSPTMWFCRVRARQGVPVPVKTYPSKFVWPTTSPMSDFASPHFSLISISPDATRAFGQRLGRTLRQHPQSVHVIALRGDLGAGKTTLTQGVAAGLGLDARVTSPTFTLVNEYEGTGLRLLHIDTYRLADAPGEAIGFGLAEMFDFEEEQATVVVIEWAERVAALLPDDHLVVELAYAEGEASRRIVVGATGPLSGAVVEALALA